MPAVDVLSKNIKRVQHNLHDLCKEIYNMIPDDVPFSFGVDVPCYDSDEEIPDELKKGVEFTSPDGVAISIETDGLAVLTDFNAPNPERLVLKNVHSPNEKDTLINFVRTSLVPQLCKEKRN